MLWLALLGVPVSEYPDVSTRLDVRAHSAAHLKLVRGAKLRIGLHC